MEREKMRLFVLRDEKVKVKNFEIKVFE